MKRSIQSGLTLGFAAAVLILVMAAVWATLATLRLEAANTQVVHTYQVRNTIARVQTQIADLAAIEIALAGPGQDEALNRGKEARERLQNLYSEIRELIRDNSAQGARVDRLESQVASGLDAIAHIADIRRRDGPLAARRAVASGVIRRHRDAIRQTIAEMQAEEDRLLTERQARSKRRVRDDLAASFGLILLDLVVLVTSWILIRRHIGRRQQAEEELRRSRDESEQQVVVRTQALAETNAALRQAALERQRAEEELRVSEERFRAVFNQAAVGIKVSDLDGQWVEVNPRLGDILGYPSSSLVGASLPDFEDCQSGETDHLLHDRLFRGEIDGYNLEKRLRHIQGHDVWVHLSTSLLRGAQGEPRGRISVIEDITARKVAEEGLRQSERELRNILDSLNAYVAVLSPEGMLLRANRATLEAGGLRLDDVAGQLFERTYWWSFSTTVQSRIRQAITRASRGELQRFDVLMRIGESHLQTIDLALSPMYDECGVVTHMIASGMDITDRKRTEEENLRLNESLEKRVRERTSELQEAYHELEAFAFSVSHDLRAPVRHIGGYADLLAKKSAGMLDDSGRRYLETIRDAARGAGILIDNLLAMSRMGRTAVRRVEVNMDELATEARRDIEPESEGRIIDWKIEPLPRAQGDPALLRLALRNLLSNAVKYTRNRPDAQIELSGTIQGEEAVYRIRDNGAGFDMKYADKLFGVFQRLHSADQFEGTGVGLANVRRIVHRHGGRTWAEGSVGHGAAFSFSLPRAESDLQSENEADEPESIELVRAAGEMLR
jgi:PAS domain S-box-containing protein